MSATHFVVWADDARTHIATRNAYRHGEATWRCDDARYVPQALVEALGWWEWQTPVNGPFPAFDVGRLEAVADWLQSNGYTVQMLDEVPS